MCVCVCTLNYHPNVGVDTRACQPNLPFTLFFFFKYPHLSADLLSQAAVSTMAELGSSSNGDLELVKSEINSCPEDLSDPPEHICALSGAP